MEYTLASAAVAAGVNRSTILRAIKSGKLSARRLEDRSFRIDASELARVYELHQAAQGEREALPGHAQGLHQPAQAAPDLATVVELAELRVKVKLLEREREMILDRERASVEDLRKRLDSEQEERRALQRLLSPPTPEKAQESPVALQPKETMAKPSRGILGRLWGR